MVKGVCLNLETVYPHLYHLVITRLDKIHIPAWAQTCWHILLTTWSNAQLLRGRLSMRMVFLLLLRGIVFYSVCVCVRACVRACVGGWVGREYRLWFTLTTVICHVWSVGSGSALNKNIVHQWTKLPPSSQKPSNQCTLVAAWTNSLAKHCLRMAAWLYEMHALNLLKRIR